MLSFGVKNSENAFPFSLIQHSPRSDARRKSKGGFSGQNIAKNVATLLSRSINCVSNTFSTRCQRKTSGKRGKQVSLRGVCYSGSHLIKFLSLLSRLSLILYCSLLQALPTNVQDQNYL